MPGARCTRSLVCKFALVKRTRAYTVHRKHSGIPVRNGFTAYSVLSPVTGLVLPPSSAD